MTAVRRIMWSAAMSYGPMGRELIPFATREAALEFSKDHGGNSCIDLEQITPAVIDKLD